MEKDGRRPQERQGPGLEAVHNGVAGGGRDPAVEAGGCADFFVKDEGGDGLVVGVGRGGGGGGGVLGVHILFLLEGVGEEDLKERWN